MRYLVLTPGLYQRESGLPDGSPIVAREPGEIVEVSDLAAPRFLAAGIIAVLEPHQDGRRGAVQLDDGYNPVLDSDISKE